MTHYRLKTMGRNVDRADAVLRAVKRLGPRATNRQIADRAAMSVSAATLYLRLLRDQGRIRISGGTRNRRVTVPGAALPGCDGSPLPWRTRREMGLEQDS